MQFSETKSEKTQFSIQSSDNKSYLNENISSLSTQPNQSKEILITKGHILELENFICEIKSGMTDLNRKIEYVEECKISKEKRMTQNLFTVRRCNKNIFYFSISQKINSKAGKTAKSENHPSKSKNQKSILNLGFIKTIKVTDKSLRSSKKSQGDQFDYQKEKLNLNSKLIEVDMNEDIIDEEDDENMVNEIDKKEETIVIPLHVSETEISNKNMKNELTANINLIDNNLSEKNLIQFDDINSISGVKNLINNNHFSEKNIYDVSTESPNEQNVQSLTSLGNDALNKVKRKIDLDDKTVNYNQKFFDYKTLHKEKEKETINLKTKHDSSDCVNTHKRLKNDWIKKEGEGVKKSDASPGPNSIQFRQEYISLSDKKQSSEKHDKSNININNNKTSYDHLDYRKEIEVKHDLTPIKEIPRRLALESKFNSEKKIELSQLSLAFDTELTSKEKIQINNNFVPIPGDPGKKSNRFSDFLKLKEEKNINISKIKEEMQTKVEKRNSYELDLRTLEDTFDDFYNLKPKNAAHKTKRNPILNLPADYKSNSSSNINLKTSAFISNRNGIIRNKKEREKMNGHKCEICESFYEILGENSETICQSCSRHRTDEDPNKTPKVKHDI